MVKSDSTWKPHAHRSLAVFTVVPCLIAITFVVAYYVNNEDVREKHEYLSPQERWSILEIKYGEVEGWGDHTNITLKYLGENMVVASIESNYYRNAKLAIWHSYRDLGICQKGDVITLSSPGYTCWLKVHFGRESTLENEAEFDVLHEEEFVG